MSCSAIINYEIMLNITQYDPKDKEFIKFIILSCSMEIESYCHRTIRERTIIELHDGRNQSELYLHEYPVSQVNGLWYDKNRSFSELNLISPKLYSVSTQQSYSGDKRITSIQLIDDIRFPVGRNAIKVEYIAGYTEETMPEDIKSAFVELVSWTLQRHKSKQIGVNGFINQQGRAVQNTFEQTMPLSVQEKLRPYRRRPFM